jgi:hypothetical protein
MYHYDFEVLVREKQKEIEKISNEAWKFANVNKESFLQKRVRKFTYTKNAKTELSNQNNCVCYCEC